MDTLDLSWLQPVALLHQELLSYWQNNHLTEHASAAATSFALIFAAEMGDKSQLVCMSLAAHHRALPVLLGAVLAFAFLNGLAVVFGLAIASWLPAYVVSAVVAILFAVFGLQALRAGADEATEDVAEKSSHSIFFSTFLLITVAEFGDKTQLAVVALSSTNDPLTVWLGATLALSATSALGIVAGRRILKSASSVWLHRLSGGIFLVLALLAGYRAYTLAL